MTRKFKLLLVDDEPRQLRALQKVILRIRPDYIVEIKSDGLEALEELNRQVYDMIITDIKMPNMDGLELMKHLYEQKAKLKRFILSGYEEFDYAQQAIKYGVQHYLVKPIKKSELEDMLLTVEEEILSEEQYKKIQEIKDKKLEESLPIYMEQQLNRWILSKPGATTHNEVEKILPFKGCGSVLLIKSKTNESDRLSRIFPEIKIEIKQFLNFWGHSLSFELENNPGTIISVINAENRYHINDMNSRKHIEKFLRTFEESTGISLAIGFSGISDNIFEESHKMYNQAEEAYKRFFYHYNDSFVFYTDIVEIPFKKSINLNLFETELLEAIKNVQQQKVTKVIHEGIGQFTDYVEPMMLKQDIELILLKVIDESKYMMTRTQYKEFQERVRVNIRQINNIFELQFFTNEVIKGLLDILINHKNDVNAKVIEECQVYIQERYFEDISLEAMASMHHFSSTYFSNLFKQQAGISFIRYITKVRLNQSVEKLINSNQSIASIAESIGIHDPAYFNRLFKKEMGITPNKYRKMNHKN